MNGSNLAIDKLTRIQGLWADLGRTRSHTTEYETIMNRIRVLSAEYQAIVESSKTPEKPRRATIPIVDAQPD